MKPNFKDINIKASEKASMSAAEWEKANHIAKNWTTPELIPVKPGTVFCHVPFASLDDPSVCRILYR